MDVRLHEHESDRLVSLRSYRVLDTGPGEDFDALTRLAARVCDAPTALISLVDRDRQWFLSRHGMPRTQTPRTDSLCSDVVAAAEPLVLPELLAAPRYAQLQEIVVAQGYRAYAGMPLIGRDGLPLGALCVLDRRAREFPEDQLAALRDLARHAVNALELRRLDAVGGLTSPALVPEATEPVSLRRALDNSEFVPYFQPLVDMRDGWTVGLEALVRWQHPTRGLLTPDAFLPGLETGTLANWTTRAVLQSSCLLLGSLREAGLALPDGVAVNVSGQQLGQPGFAGRMLGRLARHGLPGSALTVEVTETAEVTDLALTVRELRTLRGEGVRVVADDFGVGWSNLTRLLQLPLTGLKIDKELVTGMLGDPVREHMVASAISLGETMGLDVVAEGVETEAVRQRLVALGCLHGQGWLFGKALPAQQVPALLAGGRDARVRPLHDVTDRPAGALRLADTQRALRHG